MHIVMTASAQMPASCKGRYGRVAVVELTPEYAAEGKKPAFIGARARGTQRVVETWERLNMGGSRSAYQVALREAEALAAALNVEDVALVSA